MPVNVLLESIVQGQLENDYGGFQQYTKAIASTVAKVDHVLLFSLRNYSYLY